VSWASWAFWGFAATIVLTTIMALGQALRLTRMSIPFILGTMFTADRERAKVYGFLVHLVNGQLFSLLYVGAFHFLHFAAWWLGLAIGLIHGAFVLLAGLPILPGLHPRMATDRHGPSASRSLEPPGVLALNYGVRTPISTMIAHLAFGLILGAFYRP
jgi:hypothetical protein